jgi:hypothetical protein
MKTTDAQTIALKILTFLVSDAPRAETFMTITGLSPSDLRSGASSNTFLAGVVDYLLANEKLLVAFADEENIKPDSIIAVRRALPGGDIDF